eukprot:scaffold3481_cov115-Cylindrotheca_fusiformis.AAC.7
MAEFQVLLSIASTISPQNGRPPHHSREAFSAQHFFRHPNNHQVAKSSVTNRMNNLRELVFCIELESLSKSIKQALKDLYSNRMHILLNYGLLFQHSNKSKQAHLLPLSAGFAFQFV